MQCLVPVGSIWMFMILFERVKNPLAIKNFPHFHAAPGCT
jgi:hypothetical protein